MTAIVDIPGISIYIGKNILSYMVMTGVDYPWAGQFRDWKAYEESAFVAVGPNPAELSALLSLYHLHLYYNIINLIHFRVMSCLSVTPTRQVKYTSCRFSIDHTLQPAFVITCRAVGMGCNKKKREKVAKLALALTLSSQSVRLESIVAV